VEVGETTRLNPPHAMVKSVNPDIRIKKILVIAKKVIFLAKQSHAESAILLCSERLLRRSRSFAPRNDGYFLYNG
jgi:hypothetical protein